MTYEEEPIKQSCKYCQLSPLCLVLKKFESPVKFFNEKIGNNVSDRIQEILYIHCNFKEPTEELQESILKFL